MRSDTRCGQAKPLYRDVSGAPFKIGDRVRVARGTDETFSHHQRGRLGTLSYFEYHCGCGQTYPNDPMIGVTFRDAAVEEFWKEELVLITPRLSRQRKH